MKIGQLNFSKINLLAWAILFLSLMSALITTPPAAALVGDTCTWNGSVDNQFSTPGNWSGCTSPNIPENGDHILFDNTGAGSTISANNNFAALRVGNIRFQGSSAYNFVISGNNIDAYGIFKTGTGIATVSTSLVASVDDLYTEVDNGGSLVLSGVISGPGNVEQGGLGTLTLSGSNTYTGATKVWAGNITVTNPSGLGSTTGNTVVLNDASLRLDLTGDNLTIAEPLDLDGDGSASNKTLEVTRGTGTASEITLSGAIVLNPGPAITLGSDRPLVLSGVISGTGGLEFFDISSDNAGSLKLAGTNTYSGTSTVNDIFTTNGNQPGNFTINSGGILKGTGSVGRIVVNAGGTLSPGFSPGCITAGPGPTAINGGFDVEIGGTVACSEYDQLQIVGTIDVTGGTLNLSRWNNFTPSLGQTYTIIDNDSADAVIGTFAGLAQGATITVDGHTFTISYTGGTGNDIVLTVTGVPPSTPNTGFQLLSANPTATLVASLGAIVSIYALVRLRRLEK